jgi:hypothetical protein
MSQSRGINPVKVNYIGTNTITMQPISYSRYPDHCQAKRTLLRKNKK